MRKAAEECASAQQKASVLESGFRQLRALCDELQCELVRSAREAEFWRNAAEEAERGRKDAREEAAQAIEKVEDANTWSVGISRSQGLIVE